jgi:hypothetical protein
MQRSSAVLTGIGKDNTNIGEKLKGIQGIGFGKDFSEG